MNKPYIKEYDKEGNVTNPITDKYELSFLPRRYRRYRSTIKNNKSGIRLNVVNIGYDKFL